MRVCLIGILLLGISQGSSAVPWYMGYSGAPGRGTCAGTCHGTEGGTVAVTDFPAQYTPEQTYLITVARISGSSINNLNGSCRVGTGTSNAGTLSAGTGTVTYFVTGETNGIRMSSNNQNSVTFSWTAPEAGIGSVRLYVAAHQGNHGGANTIIMQESEEINPIPAPAELTLHIYAPHACLRWNPVEEVSAYNVYRDTTENLQPTPEHLIGSTSATIFVDSNAVMLPGMMFFYAVTAVEP